MIISRFTLSPFKLFKVSETRGTILFSKEFPEGDQVTNGLRQRVELNET